MDYLCAKFGDFSFSRFGFIVRTDRITEADQRYTHATTVGVSNNQHLVVIPCSYLVIMSPLSATHSKLAELKRSRSRGGQYTTLYV